MPDLLSPELLQLVGSATDLARAEAHRLGLTLGLRELGLKTTRGVELMIFNDAAASGRCVWAVFCPDRRVEYGHSPVVGVAHNVALTAMVQHHKRLQKSLPRGAVDAA